MANSNPNAAINPNINYNKYSTFEEIHPDHVYKNYRPSGGKSYRHALPGPDTLKTIYGLCKTGDSATLLSMMEYWKDNPVINVRDASTGYTALMYAASSGHYECTRIMYAAGANINKTDNHGKTALFHAKANGHEKVITYLEEHGGKLEGDSCACTMC